MEESCYATRHANFSYFTQLPTELRLKIYSLSLSASRLVPLHCLGTSGGSGGYTESHHGCTSSASIPGLLHTSRESRALAQKYYTLSFNLNGPVHMFPPKVWFSTGKGGDDVLYFGPQAGYLASYKHFVMAMTVLDLTEALKVKRLAVHEDLFLRVRRERGPFDWNPDANRSKDVLIDRCIRDFWEHVMEKFRSVEEVIIVGTGMEHQILNRELICTDTWMMTATEPRIPTFGYQGVLSAKITRAVAQLQAMQRLWTAPRWIVLSLPEHVTAGNMFCDKPTEKMLGMANYETCLTKKTQFCYV